MKTHQKSDPKMEPKSIKNHSKIDAKKGTNKWGLKLYKPGMAECAGSPKAIISKESFGRKQRRKPTEGWVQRGVQKVDCKRHVQKGKCRQGTHYAPKHARWPAATCGSLTRIPPGQGLGLLRSPTSTKTEQKWDQHRPQMGPIWARGGWGEGATEKIGGLNGWAFTEVLSTNVINMAYKIEHIE